MAVTLVSPPEQGQLVSVRWRHWVVTEVRPSTLPMAALEPTFTAPQHLFTLSSVEDDGLGEELKVIWEIEPGARVIEKVALPEPTGFDPPNKLDSFSTRPTSWTPSSTPYAGGRLHRRREEHPGSLPLRHRHRGLPA